MSDRRPLMVGNWKMNANHLEAIQMVQKLSYRLDPGDYDRVDVVVAPAFTALRSVQIVIEQDHMPIGLGAQDVHWEPEGAYTGEVSAPMLAKLGVGHVIVGHSERRQMFGETDETVNRKTRAVLDTGMVPVVCVGENLGEREEGRAEEVVIGQVRAGLNRNLGIGSVVVAYEPVWAIGTGRNALPDDAGVMAEMIRETMRDMADTDVAEGTRLLYGGSVNAGNIKDFMAKRHVDGALVGGASLDPDSFAAIVRYFR
ncbi:MAG: triose-phosphate isomerase [Actinobacteria bacterium]|nr:triose-phosphate isomerase [Actinomycetota bacterium]MCI0678497.1 triose-phosphate isomerase [Actinomycetota bacterium]